MSRMSTFLEAMGETESSLLGVMVLSDNWEELDEEDYLGEWH